MHPTPMDLNPYKGNVTKESRMLQNPMNLCPNKGKKVTRKNKMHQTPMDLDRTKGKSNKEEQHASDSDSSELYQGKEGYKEECNASV
mmetsp:Transcript_446/g.692  ORF Transcript_446/g.692 Transcript_446/m.692 type:complete len:87 (+) Transcript_446:368-628(+)